MSAHRIVVVEDESIVALDIKLQLERLGYEVPAVFQSGEELLSSLGGLNVDLVFLDILLKGEMDGVETARRVKESYGLPVILLTALDNQETLERAKIAEPFAFIAKPFDERDLRNAVVISLYRHGMEQALRRKEEQLRRSQKMEAIGRLTGGIAHDFNNLLTVILGYAKLMNEELARADLSDSRALKRDLEGIRKAALRSAALTRQLLSFSRHQTQEKRTVDVNQIVADMEKMLERLVGDDVRMQVDLLAADARVRIDPSQLEQVVMNLAVNARDAMPDGGRLTIRTDVRELAGEAIGGRDDLRPGRFVAMTVRDTGVGMSPETAEKVFEPFFTTKALGQGTGLGLSTVYGIVAQGGGFVELDSDVGRGTTFTVHLPVHEEGVVDGQENETLHDAAGGSETILLVEDEDAVRDLLSRVLRRKGYHVIEAASPGEALLLHEQHADQIALVVTDVVMPHLSGLALAERLREGHPDLPVLLISAYPDGHLGDESRDAPEYHYMQKPVDPARFVGLVRAILDD